MKGITKLSLVIFLIPAFPALLGIIGAFLFQCNAVSCSNEPFNLDNFFVCSIWIGVLGWFLSFPLAIFVYVIGQQWFD